MHSRILIDACRFRTGGPVTGKLVSGAFWRRFATNRGGGVALLFGLLIAPMMAFVGGAIDYANAYRMRSELQSALDTATLAAGREVDSGGTVAQAKEIANSVLAANLGESYPGYLANVEIDLAAKTVTGTASMDVGTFILGLVGQQNFSVHVNSEVTLPDGKVEIAMVLDNSGSMAGSRISALKDAARSLARIVFAAPTEPDFVKVAVVPFAAAVNVGSQHRGAAWMDMEGVSPIHYENFEAGFAAPRTRWTLFDDMRSTSWAGCVEVRRSPHDVTDTLVYPGDPDSYFVPMFAPDEPDSGYHYYNDYLDDDEGDCSGSTWGMSEEKRQERTCKYRNERPSGGGPNYMCDSRAITALTATESVIQDAIDDMVAVGATNIMEGVMWGWRVLSPDAPFTEGRSYSDDDNRKVMIIMSDGANTHYGTSNQNLTRFSAFGFAKNGRLRSPTNSSSRLADAMNEKTAVACSNAKAAGVIVYTVAFDISDRDTLDLLEGCATNSARAFTINNGNALLAVFEAIADDINKLRISG